MSPCRNVFSTGVYADTEYLRKNWNTFIQCGSITTCPCSCVTDDGEDERFTISCDIFLTLKTEKIDSVPHRMSEGRFGGCGWHVGIGSYHQESLTTM